MMAKDLIRTRHQITKFYALKSQLQGVADAIDDALEGDDEEEEETEELASQVLDEIGIDIICELVKAPTAAVNAPATASKFAQHKGAAGRDSGIDADLQARLDNLRKFAMNSELYTTEFR
ncbi:hypothetical protein LUZ63_012452 [Rhynchospora breviuscula]|uniref:Uncharacterized protein n=1 Tax=Rhynchospora breviuscula TaxID=2022672 RepID=A0A9Q0CKP5_9POAL|nr:hypothetical protein LUZ63_012452 [Rhynchospora breviuscula]